MFATSNNYEVGIWDTNTGLNIASFSGKGNPLAFSPIDNQLALTNETSTEIWDYTSLELLFTLENHSGELWRIAFSPDGEALAVAAVDTITLWDVEQQEILDTFAGRWSVVFSPDGTKLIYFDPEFSIVSYDMISRDHRQIAEELVLVTNFAFKPNTDIIALSFLGGEIALLDTLTGKTTTYHSGYQYPITSLVFDTDGTHLSTAGRNPFSADSFILGTAARQWNISTHEDVILAENETLVSMFVFTSPSDTPIILGSDLDQETIWDVPTDTLLIDLMGYGLVSNIAVDPNGDTVAIGVNDGTFRLYDISTGAEVYQSSRLPSSVYSLAFNQDGTLLAIGQGNGMISVFSVEEQRIIHEFTHVSMLADPTLSFGADRFLAAGDIGSIELWDFRTEELLFLNEEGMYVTDLTFSSDGSILVVGYINGIITLFDTDNGSELISIQAHSPEIGAITAITFNPERTMIAVGSNDGTISLWGIGDV